MLFSKNWGCRPCHRENDGKWDKSVIVCKESRTLRDILLEAYEYVVNRKSVIEWIMGRYGLW